MSWEGIWLFFLDQSCYDVPTHWYIMRKANLRWFTACTAILLPPQTMPCDEIVKYFMNVLLHTADISPMTRGKTRKIRILEWSSLCEIAKQEWNWYWHTTTEPDKIMYKWKMAKAQNTCHLSQLESRESFVSSINVNTPISKVWSHTRKVTGK